MAAKLLVTLALALILGACNSSSNPPHAAAARQVRNHGFVRAKITRRYDAHENKVKTAAINIDDPVQLQKLIMFFPGVETGRQSAAAGEWKSAVDVRLFRADGSSHYIKSDYRVWSEGNGDFPLRGPFRQYVSSLFP